MSYFRNTKLLRISLVFLFYGASTAQRTKQTQIPNVSSPILSSRLLLLNWDYVFNGDFFFKSIMFETNRNGLALKPHICSNLGRVLSDPFFGPICTTKSASKFWASFLQDSNQWRRKIGLDRSSSMPEDVIHLHDFALSLETPAPKGLLKCSFFFLGGGGSTFSFKESKPLFEKDYYLTSLAVASYHTSLRLRKKHPNSCH